ncbi:MAG: 30S ribosomal protein S6 [Bacteroidetes bacterium]|nr:30S ribosomal protein S6 [Bacteroidota bacterium]MCH8524074.1 30S ribosomal protein S6 [Balneolales bacterium]
MKKNYYELTYIVNAVLDEEQIKATVAKFTEFLTNNEAEIDEVAEWGIQSLEYEIDKKGTGYYVNVYYSAPGELIAKLERAMQIDDNIMRYLNIRYDNKMLQYRELQKKGETPVLRERTEEDKQ